MKIPRNLKLAVKFLNLFRKDRVSHSTVGVISIAVPNLYNDSIFEKPICLNSFETLVLKISAERVALYFMTVYRPPNSDSERYFCTISEKFLIDWNLFGKNLLFFPSYCGVCHSF